jgi:hypothetical protein
MAKIGIEVEGRLCGIKTLFCTAYEISNENFKIEVPDDVRGLYISDHNNILDLYELTHLTERFIVTVERTKVSEHPENVNIILTIDNESFWSLHPNDQIKFSKDLTVFATTKRTMVITRPEDFTGDIEI